MSDRNNLVSIILPVRNGAIFLDQAIASVLSQTYCNFELLIIDNGSTDGSYAISQKYPSTDSRVSLHRCEKVGIVNAINLGLSLSTGKYIARIDCDDIWLPYKLEVQMEYLLQNPNIALLGSSVEIINSEGNLHNNQNSFNSQKPLKWEEIRRNLSVKNLFCHSSVVFNREVAIAVGGYRNYYPHSEDYELWCRIAKEFPSEICSDILVKFRIHNNSISKRKFLVQHISSIRVKINFCFQLGNPILNGIRIAHSLLRLFLLIIAKLLKGIVKIFDLA
jgi:glycosyltransferase involved in cell wall biosynthesis